MKTAALHSLLARGCRCYPSADGFGFSFENGLISFVQGMWIPDG
jgi:hypothetical protein